MNVKPNLAIVTTTKAGVSDTFIQAHIQMLNSNVFAFYGTPMPVYPFDDNNCRKSESRWWRLLPEFLYQKLTRKLQDPEQIIEQYFLANNIQVVLAEYGYTGCKILPVCKKLSIPLIVHFHGHDAYIYSILKELKEKYIEIFGYAKYVISVSHNMTNQLIKLGASSEKIIYNPYGPREDFFSISPDYTQKTFLSVGRFVEKKAPWLTILAFQIVQQKIPDAKLILVGEGTVLPVCKTLVKSLGIPNVTFMGALQHSETLLIFAQASCFVQHSIVASDGDSEGTPVSILEAGAAGLPVIATKHAGIPDVVIEGITGFLVSETDVNAMATQMEKVIGNDYLKETMGKAARENIRNNFPLKKHLNTLDKLINDVIE